jgi:hypothetical protein
MESEAEGTWLTFSDSKTSRGAVPQYFDLLICEHQYCAQLSQPHFRIIFLLCIIVQEIPLK